MTRAGALLLLCAALLFIVGGKCDDICPALRDTVDLFISESHEAYIEQVEKYNQNSEALETADTLKSCVDEKLTVEDKQHALSALEPRSKKILMNEQGQKEEAERNQLTPDDFQESLLSPARYLRKPQSSVYPKEIDKIDNRITSSTQKDMIENTHMYSSCPFPDYSECDDICPAVRDTVDLFISGSHEAYIEQVEKYNQNSDVLETADTLKSCVDEKLTPQDKQDALSALAWDPPGPPDSVTSPAFGGPMTASASLELSTAIMHTAKLALVLKPGADLLPALTSATELVPAIRPRF
ncbi:hypothetical protein E5288_WYG014636 [Bos mutus]|uniref:Major allergen I polypeptide chain 1 n=2 Tax=Bos mutus TaxID=72004 RepID=A0A6B0R2S8_9CETA|nr:hypothetical protein [Bos mutus]